MGNAGERRPIPERRRWARNVLYAVCPAGVVLLALGFAAPYLVTPLRASLAVGGPFTLEDGAGHVVTERSWSGNYLLVYFGYTHCPALCPTTLASMAEALDSLGKAANAVQPLFITVDPARDTPAVLARFVPMFSPRLLGLTGTRQQVAQAARVYRVYYAEHRTGPGPADYTMDHSSMIYLMAPTGRIAALIDASEAPKQIAATISQAMRGDAVRP